MRKRSIEISELLLSLEPKWSRLQYLNKQISLEQDFVSIQRNMDEIEDVNVKTNIASCLSKLKEMNAMFQKTV
jgi:hypothetical protein